MPDILKHLLSQTADMAFQNGASASAFAIVPIAAIAVTVSRDTILNPFRHSPSLLKFSALVPGSSRCLGVSETTASHDLKTGVDSKLLVKKEEKALTFYTFR